MERETNSWIKNESSRSFCLRRGHHANNASATTDIPTWKENECFDRIAEEGTTAGGDMRASILDKFKKCCSGCKETMNGVRGLTRRRTCMKCRSVFCAQCKRKYMTHVGWRKWVCKESCKTSLLRRSLRRRACIEIIVQNVELSTKTAMESMFSASVVLADTKDVVLRLETTPTVRVPKGRKEFLWAHRVVFDRIRSDDVDDLMVHVDIRDERQSGSRSKDIVATWPWSLSRADTSDHVLEHTTNIIRTDSSSDGENCDGGKWIPLEGSDGAKCGRVRLRVTLLGETGLNGDDTHGTLMSPSVATPTLPSPAILQCEDSDEEEGREDDDGRENHDGEAERVATKKMERDDEASWRGAVLLKRYVNNKDCRRSSSQSHRSHRISIIHSLPFFFSRLNIS